MQLSIGMAKREEMQRRGLIQTIQQVPIRACSGITPTMERPDCQKDDPLAEMFIVWHRVQGEGFLA
jgi:hypothetical protein